MLDTLEIDEYTIDIKNKKLSKGEFVYCTNIDMQDTPIKTQIFENGLDVTTIKSEHGTIVLIVMLEQFLLDINSIRIHTGKEQEPIEIYERLKYDYINAIMLYDSSVDSIEVGVQTCDIDWLSDYMMQSLIMIDLRKIRLAIQL